MTPDPAGVTLFGRRKQSPGQTGSLTSGKDSPVPILATSIDVTHNEETAAMNANVVTPTPETPTPTTRKHKEVWLVEDTAKGRSLWTRVGTAFVNADGSITLRMSALPVGAGTLMIR